MAKQRETLKVEIEIGARVWADHSIEVEKHRAETGCECTPESVLASLLTRKLFKAKLQDMLDNAVEKGTDDERDSRLSQIVGNLMLSIMSKRPCSDPEVNELVVRTVELMEDYDMDVDDVLNS